MGSGGSGGLGWQVVVDLFEYADQEVFVSSEPRCGERPSEGQGAASVFWPCSWVGVWELYPPDSWGNCLVSRGWRSGRLGLGEVGEYCSTGLGEDPSCLPLLWNGLIYVDLPSWHDKC